MSSSSAAGTDARLPRSEGVKSLSPRTPPPPPRPPPPPPPADELRVLGDDLDRLAVRAVLRLPLAPLEAPVDQERGALGQVAGDALALGAPDRDVEVVRDVRPLVGVAVLLARVDG